MFISFNGGHGGVWCLHAKIYKFIVYYIDDSAGRLRDIIDPDGHKKLSADVTHGVLFFSLRRR